MEFVRRFFLACLLLSLQMVISFTQHQECDVICEHGFIDYVECSCVCRSGWHGTDCGSKCLDARGADYCVTLETNQGICDDQKFISQMEEQCAATCGFCEKFGPGSEGFVCEKTCANPGGRLNSATCVCECASGWYGELCENKCEDSSDNCGLWQEANQCGTPFVDEKCPATCGMCEPFGPGSPGFYCLLDCVNGGSLIDTDRDCRCECAKGWQGEQCDAICLNDEEACGDESGARYTVEQCLTEDYVYNKCPVLCKRCDKFGPGAPGFECSLECLNGGVLVNNETDCFCQCQDGWEGIKCEETCEDSNKRCAAMSKAGYCENSQYGAWMMKKCAQSCGFCHDNERGKGYGNYFLVHTELPRTEDEIRRERGVNDFEYHRTGPGIEIVFLLDASASVGEIIFQKQKTVLLEFVDLIDFEAEGGVRALFLAFDTNTRLGRNLYDIHSKEDARKSLKAVKYEGGQSKLTAALRVAKHLVFAHSRDEAHKVFYLVSDGLYTGDRPVKLSQDMRSKGVEIYALVMVREGCNVEVLEEMTGDLEHIIFVDKAEDIPLPYMNIATSNMTSPAEK